MSKYVGLLQRHWEQYRPNELAAMGDRDEFFKLTAAGVAAEVNALAAAIAGPDVQGESPTERFRRLESARMTAESDVLREMLPPTEEDEAGEEETRESLIDQSEWEKTKAIGEAWDEAESCGLPTQEETDAFAEQRYARRCQQIDAELDARLQAIGEPPVSRATGPEA